MVAAHSFLLLTVFQEFVRFSNKDIEQIIKKEMSGDVKNSFYAIGNKCLTIATFYYRVDGGQRWPCSLYFAVCSVKNQPSYFADRLYKAMKVFIHNVWHYFVL